MISACYYALRPMGLLGSISLASGSSPRASSSCQIVFFHPLGIDAYAVRAISNSPLAFRAFSNATACVRSFSALPRTVLRPATSSLFSASSFVSELRDRVHISSFPRRTPSRNRICFFTCESECLYFDRMSLASRYRSKSATETDFPL